MKADDLITLVSKHDIVDVAKGLGLKTQGTKIDVVKRVVRKIDAIRGSERRESYSRIPWPRGEKRGRVMEAAYRLLNEVDGVEDYIEVPEGLVYGRAKRAFYDEYGEDIDEYARAINRLNDGEVVGLAHGHYSKFEEVWSYLRRYRQDLGELYRYVEDRDLLKKFVDRHDPSLDGMSVEELRAEYARRVGEYMLDGAARVDMVGNIDVVGDGTMAVTAMSEDALVRKFIISTRVVGDGVASYRQVSEEIMRLLRGAFGGVDGSGRKIVSVSLKFKFEPPGGVLGMSMKAPSWRQLSFKRLEDIEQLGVLLHDIQHGVRYGSEEIDESYEVDFGSISGFVVESMGGGCGGGKRGQRVVGNGWVGIDLAGKVRGNNCLIATVARALRSDTTVSFARCRRLCGLKHDCEIGIGEVGLVEKYFSVRVNVYGEGGLLRRSDGGYGREVNVMINNNHYLLLESIDGGMVSGGGGGMVRVMKGADVVRKIIVYDIETVYGVDGGLEPYSIDWMLLDEDFVEEDVGRCVDAWHCDISERVDVMSSFVGFLNGLENCRAKIIGFGSSSFDNHILLNALARLNESGVGGIRIVGSRVLRMSYRGRFEVWDLGRFVPMGLGAACEQFGTMYGKVDGFVHDNFQKAYERDMIGRSGLIELVKMRRSELMKYNRGDIMATACLYRKYSDAVRMICGYDCLSYSTGPGLAYGVWSGGMVEVEREVVEGVIGWYREGKIEGVAGEQARRICDGVGGGLSGGMVKVRSGIGMVLPLLDEERYRFVRGCLIGGRSEVFGEGRPVVVDGEELGSVDCVSLYPYVMMERDYPIGALLETSVYVEGCIGFYRIRVKSQAGLVRNILPLRVGFVGGGYVPLDWKYRGEMVVDCCSVDIECLRRHGVEYELVGERHYYFEKTYRGLFDGFLRPLKEVKMREDAYRRVGDVRYNRCVRECSKFLQNSLSGKVIERLGGGDQVMFDVGKVVIGENEVLEDLIMVGNRALGIVKYVNNFVSSRQAPCYLGVLIYAYAREHMYEKLLCRRDLVLYNMETDSVSIRMRDIGEIEGLIGEEYGEFKLELRGCVKSVFVSPKNYCMLKDGDCKVLREGSMAIGGKIKMKGVRWTDRVVTGEVDGIGRCVDRGYEWKVADVVVQHGIYDGLVDRAMTWESFLRLAREGELCVVSSQIVRETCGMGYEEVVKKVVVGLMGKYDVGLRLDMNLCEILTRVKRVDKMEYYKLLNGLKRMAHRAFVIRQRFVIKNITVRVDA